MARHAVDVRVRLLARLVPGPGGCLDWTGARGQAGYGLISWRPDHWSPQYTHRVAYTLHHRVKLQPGDVVAHRCDRPSCCNPDHLFLTNIAGNMADKVAKGRQSRGEGVGTAKLKEREVVAIRLAKSWGEHAESIAARYDISSGHVYTLVSRRNWA